MNSLDDAKRKAVRLRVQAVSARQRSRELITRSNMLVKSARAVGARVRQASAHALGEAGDGAGCPPDASVPDPRRLDHAELPETLDEAGGPSVAEERERIAAELSGSVIQRVFAAGLSLNSAAGMTTDSQVRKRIEAAVRELDQVIRDIRNVVFHAQAPPPPGTGLSQDVLGLSERLATTASISFSGLAGGTVLPADKSRLLLTLRLVLGLIGEHATPESIDITAGSSSYQLTIEAASLSPAPLASGAASWLASIEARAAQTGASVATEPLPGGVRLTCQVAKVPPQRLAR